MSSRTLRNVFFREVTSTIVSKSISQTVLGQRVNFKLSPNLTLEQFRRSPIMGWKSGIPIEC